MKFYPFFSYSFVFLGAMAICNIIAVIFFALAWFSYKLPEQKRDCNVELTNMNEESAMS